MKNFRKNDLVDYQKNNVNAGITLIALVITIIVLLILAGVTIATLTGQNGILTNATKAKEETRGGNVQEARDLWVTEKKSAEYGAGTAKTLSEVLADLQAKGDLTQDEVDKIQGNEEKGIEAEGQITIGSRTIVFVTGGKTLVEMFDAGEIKIGDYLDYPTPTAGSYISPANRNGSVDQTFNVSNNGTPVNWRVLGAEGTGSDRHLLLMSGNPVKKDGGSNQQDWEFELSGALGYKYAETELNNISAIYKNSEYADSARSLNINDINQLTGVTVKTNTVETEEGTNVDERGDIGKTYSFTDQYENEDDFLAKKKTNFSKTITSYLYYWDNPALKTNTKEGARAKGMIFREGDAGYAKYWLASRGIGKNGLKIAVYFGVSDVEGGGVNKSLPMFCSDDEYELYSRTAGVCPVISLKSNITEKEIKVITDQTEEDWDLQTTES